MITEKDKYEKKKNLREREGNLHNSSKRTEKSYVNLYREKKEGLIVEGVSILHI